MEPGLSRSQLATLIRKGEITRVARGIYARGKPTPREALALLQSKHRCWATGTTAAQLLKGEELSFPVHIAGPNKMRSGPLFRLTRSQVVDYTEVNGLRVYNPLVAVSFLDHTSAVQMLEAVYSGAKGRRRLEEERRRLARISKRTQRALSDAVLFTDSSAEIKVARALKAVGLDVECNVFIGVYLWDIVLKKQRIAIEINGRKFHSGLDTWIKDHWKNNDAIVRGWRTLRYTGHCVAHHLPAIVEQVRTFEYPDFSSDRHKLVRTWHLAILRMLEPHLFWH